MANMKVLSEKVCGIAKVRAPLLLLTHVNVSLKSIETAKHIRVLIPLKEAKVRLNICICSTSQLKQNDKD